MPMPSIYSVKKPEAEKKTTNKIVLNDNHLKINNTPQNVNYYSQLSSDKLSNKHYSNLK
jgi:hypothetical protein